MRKEERKRSRRGYHKAKQRRAIERGDEERRKAGEGEEEGELI